MRGCRTRLTSLLGRLFDEPAIDDTRTLNSNCRQVDVQTFREHHAHARFFVVTAGFASCAELELFLVPGVEGIPYREAGAAPLNSDR